MREQALLYSPFQNSKNSQLRTNVIWHDSYYQLHDEISKIKSIFNYQMPYPNTKEIIDLIKSKSKPLCPIKIWIDNIQSEVNYP